METVIRSFRDLLDPGTDRGSPVVTLFSGGLDSTYLLHRLARAGFTDIHAVSVELGAGEPIEELHRIADDLGVQLHLLDGRQAFAEDFVRPAISAQAMYLGMYPISSSLSRPLIAQMAMRFATDLGASCVIHTANRSQNTLRRLNGALDLLGYQGRYGSPYELEPVSRGDKIRELADAGLARMSGRVVSVDSNLWCREFESGVVEDPENHSVPEELYRWSVTRQSLPDGLVEIGFVAGVPVSVDGVDLPLGKLIDTVNCLAGSYGIGRYSGLEHLAGGEKVLELREMPAAWILLKTCRHLEMAVLAAETIREKINVEQIWVREALEGRWFGELRAASQSFIERCAAAVTGTVRWCLKPGTAETQSIVANQPRYVRKRDEWERVSVGWTP